MELKDIKLLKGMLKDEVNELINEWLELEDEVYLGVAYKHNWKCLQCNNKFNRQFCRVKSSLLFDCGCIEYNKQEKRYKYEVEKTGEYEYIRSFRKSDILPNGKIVKGDVYIQIKHKYCGSTYEVTSSDFINNNVRCPKCCGTYEKSFAYHIEKELGLKLEDIWDFDKNILDPFTIFKSSPTTKVWIKCQKVDYHGSYEVGCNSFATGVECSYCGKHGKVHPKDSFAQYHIDNTDKDFLEKYWSDKNTVDPFTIKPKSDVVVFIKCQNTDYHEESKMTCSNFTKSKNTRCSYCEKTKIHPLDSFGYKYENMLKFWSKRNKLSPFDVHDNSSKKCFFICKKCGIEFESSVKFFASRFLCKSCASSRGESVIYNFLKSENIRFNDQKTFDGLVGIGGVKLRYDFYLYDLNTLIEYDGEFHYMDLIGNNLEKQKEHDRRKDEYAIKNDINLIRIPYWELKELDKVIYNHIDKLYTSISCS